MDIVLESTTEVGEQAGPTTILQLTFMMEMILLCHSLGSGIISTRSILDVKL